MAGAAVLTADGAGPTVSIGTVSWMLHFAVVGAASYLWVIVTSVVRLRLSTPGLVIASSVGVSGPSGDCLSFLGRDSDSMVQIDADTLLIAFHAILSICGNRLSERAHDIRMSFSSRSTTRCVTSISLLPTHFPLAHKPSNFPCPAPALATILCQSCSPSFEISPTYSRPSNNL